ncbi:MAG: FAD-binding oxidoreductase [Deltaproteobacteria bacterium]|nr:FAD-binding oxidoreductase [Deltaproteobacteria bacterium]
MTARAQSFWGWGWADKFPDDDARKGLLAFAETTLGFTGLSPRALPVLEAVEVPRSRLELRGPLAEFCTVDREQRVRHTWGRSYRDLIRGFRGDFSVAPDAVAHVRDERDLEALFEHCGRRGIALIPYGGGTSVVSGVEPSVDPSFNGVITADLRKLDRVLEVDPVSRAARMQAGGLGPRLEAQLAPHGLSLRHFPQSFEFSTLGGWLATRAGGHFATVYTHIDDLVESIRMVTPIGVWEARRLPGSGAGPSPDRVALGSEGTLGVITEAWMRLHPRPRFRSSASALFREWKAAVEATRALAQSGLYPTNCRLLDAREAMLNQVDQSGAHVLLVAFESADHAGTAKMARAAEIIRAHGGEIPRGVVERDEGAKVEGTEAGSWRSAFLEAPYLQSVLLSLGVIADTFETACTWDRFDALHAGVTAAVTETMQRLCGGGRVTCRFTHVYPDGPAPYFTFLAPARLGEEVAQWTEIKKAASDALLAHGGTITHHHAVGRLHRPWYDQERPEPFAAGLRAMKRAVDPAGILNPGVLLDL